MEITPDLLAAVRRRDQDERKTRLVEIWPDMANAVVVFFALQTQWTRSAFGQLLGIDYGRIEPTARLLGLELVPQDFHDIRTMENEVLRLARRK